MVSSKSAILVSVAAATLLVFASVPTSALRYTSIARIGGSSQLHAGFGSPNSKASRKSDAESLVNPQLKSIGVDQKCPCGSSTSYQVCCKPLHDGVKCSGVFPNPEEITRARYSSFAVGLASYIIDTTHPSHRDYKKHSESNLDPKKARKAWEKEIITKNSEVFEFLKLELLEGEEKALQKQNETLVDGHQSVIFRILVRKRSDGSLITFQESSFYVPMEAGHVPIGCKSPSTVSSKAKSGSSVAPSNTAAAEKKGWLYSHGVVTPVADDIAKRILSEAPQFLSSLSIRDRW